MNYESAILVIDEQALVQFTGKINVQDSKSSQHLGRMLMHEGDIVSAGYSEVVGLKAFYKIFVDIKASKNIELIVEPELLGKFHRNIHYPYTVLKSRLDETIDKYDSNSQKMPPSDVKLAIRGEFIHSGEPISADEYDVLCTLSDYNRVHDIYKNCELLDFEITNALVSLRRKKAIKVIKSIDIKKQENLNENSST